MSGSLIKKIKRILSSFFKTALFIQLFIKSEHYFVLFSCLFVADIKTDVLDKTSCLAALAALRRTKWFQVR